MNKTPALNIIVEESVQMSFSHISQGFWLAYCTRCLMGHTNATVEEGKQAIEQSASLITQLFNVMRPFHHREPGLLRLISLYKNGSSHGSCQIDPCSSMIVDGLRSHPVSVKQAYTLSPVQAVLVKD